jgi:lysophospholipase L1-like esterase
MFSRLHVYYDYIKDFVKLNRPVFNDPPFSNSAEFKPLFDFYKNYLSFIYNENVAISNLEKNMELYSQWLNNRRIDTLWLSYDGTPIHFKESDTFIKFDGENLGAWALKNKMRIIDVPNCNIDDLHLNLDGHRKVANMIYNKLKKRHKLI